MSDEIENNKFLDALKKLFSTQLTNSQKWIFSFVASLVFFVVASPVLYGFTNTLTTGIGLCRTYNPGGANIFGLLIHTVVYMLLIRLLLQFV